MKTFFISFFTMWIVTISWGAVDVKAYKSDNSLIKSYMDNGAFYQAALLYSKWGQIFEKEKMFKEALLTYSAGAKVYEKANNGANAIKYYRKSLDLLTNITTDEKMQLLKYKWLTNLGFLELYFNQNKVAASKYFDESEQYFKENNNHLEYAIVLKGRGVLYKISGEYERGLSILNESSTILKKLDKSEYYKVLNEIIDTAPLLQTIKTDGNWLSKYKEEILLSGNKEIISKFFLISANLSKNMDEKVNLLDMALNQFTSDTEYILKIKMLVAYGEIFLSSNPALAIQKLDEAFRIAQQIGDSKSVFTIFNYIGIAYSNWNKYENALLFFNKANNLSEQLTLQDKTVLLINIGISEYSIGQLNSATQTFKNAISNIEKLRSTIVINNEKNKRFFMSVEQAYRYLTLALIESKKYVEAFDVYEQSRARLFLNNLSVRSALVNVEASTEDVSKFNELTNSINYLQQKIDSGVNDINELTVYQDDLIKVNDEMSKYVLSLEEKYPRFKEIKNPMILKFQDVKNVLNPKDAVMMFFISKKNYVFLIKKDMKAPLVLPLDDGLDSVAELMNNSMYSSFKVKSEEYASAVDSLLKSGKLKMAMNDAGNVSHLRGIVIEKNKDTLSSEEVMDSIKNLYGYFAERLITKEVYEYLNDVDNIYYCPDGNLWTMPVEGIIIRDFKQDKYFYLGDRFNLAYIQSLSVLNMLSSKKQIVKEDAIDFIGFGGASYPFTITEMGGNKITTRKLPLNDFELKSMVNDIPENFLTYDPARNNIEYFQNKGLSWVDLPNSKVEIFEAANIFSNNMTFMGPAVSEERVKYLSENGTLAKAKVLLFSVHGYMEKDNPQMSSLVMSLTDKIATQDLERFKIVDDGYLNANEIINLKLNNPFVILSACETGKGKVEGGEGVAGLSQSFFIAGAKSVLVTLWSIGDESTQNFMKIFFKKIKDGQPPFIALRETKKEYREKFDKYQAPFYWAPFVLYGSMK